MLTNNNNKQMLAAIDLGSNSFHMIVVRHMDDGSIQLVDRVKEMVRMAAGLDENNNLSDESQQRALACISRFAERIKDIPVENIRIVGTNTLRKAKNASKFLKPAQKYLAKSIEIISGIEEARLVYLGVSHSIANNNDKNRFVIDIGGGSTETIIGKKFTPVLMESLFMGCVSMTKLFFSDGIITKKKLKKADTYTRRELERITFPFTKHGWDEVIGTSGSIRSIFNVIKMQELTDSSITPKAMQHLKQLLLEAETIDNIKFKGLSEERRPVFIGGFVVLNAIINTFNIKSINVSEGALREGLIYDLLGRLKHEDIRENTIIRMMERYSVQKDHAENVANSAEYFFNCLAKNWKINKPRYKNILRWSALLHEIGLSIAHAGYHKHGAYISRHSDMPGFSLQDQQFLSTLIHTHRQKIWPTHFELIPNKHIEAAKKLALILRLAVIFHRSRVDISLPEIKCKAENESIKLTIPKTWLEKHCLTTADLNNEKMLLANIDFKLKIKKK